MTPSGVALRLKASTSAPRAARRGVIDGMALRGTLADDVALLVSEAVTNSVLHAGLGPSELVHVDAWWAEDHVHVEVFDEGGGLRSVSPAGPREGGRGLNIIDHIASRWGVLSNGHTRIWFEIAA